MSKILFNTLTNFCDNLYKTNELISESWGREDYNSWLAGIGRITGRYTPNPPELTYADAPEALRTKYSESGFVYIDIPDNKINSVGIQKYGQHLPGKIVGYNPELNKAIIIFSSSINVPYFRLNLTMAPHTLEVDPRYLKPLTLEYFNNFNNSLSITELKKFLSTKIPGITFSSRRVVLDGEKVLASGIKNKANLIFKLHGAKGLRDGLDRLTFSIDPELSYNVFHSVIKLTPGQLNPDAIYREYQDMIEHYKDLVSSALPLKAAMELINKAVAAKGGDILITTPGEIEQKKAPLLITFATPNQVFKHNKNFGITELDSRLAHNYTDIVPKVLTVPSSNTVEWYIIPFKDILGSGKEFVVVHWKKGAIHENKPVMEILTKGTSTYKTLQQYAISDTGIPKTTSDILEIYNSMSNDGKEIFIKYLIRNE